MNLKSPGGFIKLQYVNKFNCIYMHRKSSIHSDDVIVAWENLYRLSVSWEELTPGSFQFPPPCVARLSELARFDWMACSAHV
jgi:hypothetical protein